MGRSIFKELVVIIAIPVAIWCGIVYFDLTPDESNFTLSIEKEERLGELMTQQLLIEHPEINTPTLDTALATITDRLLTPLKESEYRYQILVVDHQIVNAFALPGGHVVICQGLVEMIESPEELAAVIAHEIGHVEQRHIVKKLVKTLGLEILAGALTGGDPLLISELMKSAASMVFDRAQEREADQFALDHLLKSKINPRVIAGFFRKIQQKSTALDQKLAIVSHHPDLPSRIRAALQYKIPRDTRFEPLEIDWPAVKDSLRKRDKPAQNAPDPIPDQPAPFR